ncbi:Basic-leucine zipper domain [Dillenia turbinata]|uniref:Basic-leucine zipper domain n=1 Tax=Dillenia turbinata TaxID=194707 RepID=A0AAN8YXF3_9MAGN
MGDREDGNVDMIQRFSSSFDNNPDFSTSQIRPQMRHFSQGVGNDGAKRIGIPPISPYSQMGMPKPSNQLRGFQNLSLGPSHSRSLSQPSFFDSLPPLSPNPNFRDSPVIPVSDQVSVEALPPRKHHRRSNSDIPFGFSTLIQSSPPLIPSGGPVGLERSASVRENSGLVAPVQLIKREVNGNDEGIGERKREGEVVDDLLNAYMNLDNIDALSSGGVEGKDCKENRDDLDSRASETKTNGGDSSDNDAESSVNESASGIYRPGSSSSIEKREGIKRSANGDVAATTRHYRSLSMDSFMGKLNFGDESPKLPPSLGTPGEQFPQSKVGNGNSSSFSLEFGNGEFTAAELRKIMANEKLAEIAMTDPKRVKRILANRQSAARSKERKMRYISELEHKVQTLQTEATTLSAQVTLLQRDAAGLTTQNNELKFRLQAMEQQAQLRDALNEALTAEVQRLKLVTGELGRDSHTSKSLGQQLSMNSQIYQMHSQQQNGSTVTKQHEPNKLE